MNIRESLEALEEPYISPYTSFSSRTRGWDGPEPPCDMRPEYQRGRDCILHSRAFRRLRHKTQVFLAPEGGHYRTRLTHTLETSRIARIIAKTLRPNEGPTETIALGHDLEHTPFGHSGGYILNRIYEDGSACYQQNVRIVEILEKDGRGLNFTWEVRDGILNHRTSGHPFTLKGTIVRLSDKIVYINHDIDDIIRARVFAEDELPGEYTDILEHNVRERLNNIVYGIILDNTDKPATIMPEGMEEVMQGLRRWVFENVYKNEIPRAEEDKTQNMIHQPCGYYMSHVDELPMEHVPLIVSGGEEKPRVVYDYIAGMSDIYAIDQFEELSIPERWNVY